MSISKIRKIIRISNLALLLLIVFCHNGMAAEGYVSVSPQTITASVGDTIAIDIIVNSVGSEVYGAQYELYFDNTILSATSQTQGTFLSHDGESTNVVADDVNNTLGKIVYCEARMGTPAGVTGSDVLTSITFESIKSGTSALTLSYVMLMDSSGKEVVTTVDSGICTVAGDNMPEVTYTDVSIEEANRMIESDSRVIILDVSTMDEYDSEHIIGARWIQTSNVSAISELGEYTDWSIIVYSMDGIESRDACRVLMEHGFENSYNMVGGIEAWRVNFPVFSAPKFTPTKIPTSAPSKTVTASSTPTIRDTPSESKRLPGFEVSFAIMGLLAVLIIRRKDARK